jgi:hypothetical protein
MEDVSRFIQEFKTVEDIIQQFEAPADALKEAEILLAWYGYGDWCGSALVLYLKDGKLFEVNASHCSCNGLEGQWEPQETNWKALAIRDLRGEEEGSFKAHEALQSLVAKNMVAA